MEDAGEYVCVYAIQNLTETRVKHDCSSHVQTGSASFTAITQILPVSAQLILSSSLSKSNQNSIWKIEVKGV